MFILLINIFGQQSNSGNLLYSNDRKNANLELNRNENDSMHSANKFCIGISGFIYNSEKMGLVIGLNEKTKYRFDEINSISGIIKLGSGFNGYGAAEYRSSDANEIKSYYEISFLYNYSLNDVLNGLSIGAGIGGIFGKTENNLNYFYMCFPFTIDTEITLTKIIKIDFGINSQINTNSILWGIDLGLLLEI